MLLPEACIGHRTAERIRIKIPSRKGQPAYFSAVQKALLQNGAMDSVDVNPNTGSVLIKGARLDAAVLASVGEENSLFKLEMSVSEVEPLSRKIVAPVRDLSRSVKDFSGGELDLPGMVFLTLLGVGIFQLVRGNFAAPPWYTAFWYAMGIFTKSIVEKKA